MNKPTSSQDLETAMARFGLRVTAGLSQNVDALPHDVTERLRFAREKALETARQARQLQAAPVVAVGSSLALGGSGGGRWFKFASVMPAVLLVVGLLLIQHSEWYAQVRAAAEIDTALLSDKLPPAAYSDPGFSEYLSDEQDQ